MKEPKEAFPYKPPSDYAKKKYNNVFKLKKRIEVPLPKLIFDKTISMFFVFIAIPILIFLFFFNLIEGLIIKENRGPLFFYYYGISHGKVFKKWKIRIIKKSFIDSELQKKGDWHAFLNEWKPEAKTYMGSFVKKFYLDEIPQFFLILKGDMSFVGPRPLAIHHYERDINQGNIARKLIRGGLLGLGHIRKGSSEFGNSDYEYEYISNYISFSPIKLFCIDLKIIYKGFILVLKGGGH